MHEKQLTVRYFMLSFAIGFLVLSILAMVVVLFVPPQMMADSPDFPADPGGTYLPAEEDAFNLLLITTAEEAAKPDTFFLVRFDPVRGQIPVAAFEPGTRIQAGAQPSSLSELYAYSGVQKVASQMGRALSITIDRYAVLDGQGVVEMVDVLGGVKYTLKEKVALSGTGTQPVLQPGLNQLSGSLFYAVLQSRGFPSGSAGRCAAAAGMVAALFNEHSKLVLGSEADGIFERFVNTADTNISALDYQKFKPPAKFMSQLAGEPAFAVQITLDSSQTLSEETVKQLGEIYTAAQNRRVHV